MEDQSWKTKCDLVIDHDDDLPQKQKRGRVVRSRNTVKSFVREQVPELFSNDGKLNETQVLLEMTRLLQGQTEESRKRRKLPKGGRLNPLSKSGELMKGDSPVEDEVKLEARQRSIECPYSPSTKKDAPGELPCLVEEKDEERSLPRCESILGYSEWKRRPS